MIAEVSFPGALTAMPSARVGPEHVTGSPARYCFIEG